MSSLFSLFKGRNSPLGFGGGCCNHHHFYLSEQYFGTISKKYRHYSETFRHCSESEYSLCFRRLFQLPTSKNNQNSLKIRSIHWIFAFQVLILRTWSVKQCGLGRRDPPQNQWFKMDHWFSIGTIPKKVVGIVPNIVPHIVPNIVPIAFFYPYKLVNFLSYFRTILQ